MMGQEVFDGNESKKIQPRVQTGGGEDGLWSSPQPRPGGARAGPATGDAAALEAAGRAADGSSSAWLRPGTKGALALTLGTGQTTDTADKVDAPSAPKGQALGLRHEDCLYTRHTRRQRGASCADIVSAGPDRQL